MSSNDFIIDDAFAHFAASRNVGYRQRVQERFRVFIVFLQDNSLTTRQLLGDGEAVTEKTRIRKSDLTEIGFQVVQKAYDKWLRGIDKGKPISDVRVLEKALASIRQNEE